MQFLTVELHAAVLETRGTQFLGEGVEFYQFCGMLALVWVLLRGWWRRLARAVLHAVVLQYLLHLLVGIAAIAPDDGMRQMPMLDICLVVELEDHTIAQFLLVWSQRANEVTKTLRQHWDGAIHEIDTRSTSIGLLVDDRAFLHIMRDIGNMHAHFPQTTLQLTDTKGIVKVLGILRVDGTSKHVTEILTAVYFLLRDGSVDLLGSLLHILRILIG